MQSHAVLVQNGGHRRGPQTRHGARCSSNYVATTSLAARARLLKRNLPPLPRLPAHAVPEELHLSEKGTACGPQEGWVPKYGWAQARLLRWGRLRENRGHVA